MATHQLHVLQNDVPDERVKMAKLRVFVAAGWCHGRKSLPGAELRWAAPVVVGAPSSGLSLVVSSGGWQYWGAGSVLPLQKLDSGRSQRVNVFD